MIDEQGVVRCPLCGGAAVRSGFYTFRPYFCRCVAPYIFGPEYIEPYYDHEIERARRVACDMGGGWSWFPRRP